MLIAGARPKLYGKSIKPSGSSRKRALTATVFLIFFCGCQSPASRQSSAIQKTEILWDNWGIPHIFARNTRELFFAHGWAQARDHGDLLLRLLGQSRGRGAEYWGERYLPLDRWIHTMGVPERAVDWYRQLPAETKLLIEAFTDGINAWAEKHPEGFAEEVRPVLPVTPVDILAHSQRVIQFTFVTDPQKIRDLERERPPGSNAWAVAPRRSESGNALLLANPHLAWGDLFTWYELHMTSPEVNAYGVALVGSPVLAIAFNERLGWTHTVNTHDGDDLYELTLKDGGYLFDGQVRPFERRQKTIRVKGQEGGLREETLSIEHSVHGPVVRRNGNRALALRVVGLQAHDLVGQYWQMMRAHNLEQFESALRRLQMPMFTVMYADREGHILHLFGGLTPVRPEGDWNWAGIVPGDTSETLWSEIHPYEELPRVLDPSSGWLQNANDPPWTTTFPPALDPGQFPRYMAPGGMSFRAQQSALLLNGDERISFEELIQYKHSTVVRAAERLLDDLIPAARKSSEPLAIQAAEVLERWDRTTRSESRGAVLFEAFFHRFQESHNPPPFALKWRPDRPLDTPDGLADPASAVQILVKAAAEVKEHWGVLDIPWGEVKRLRLEEYDFPAQGGPGDLGIFRTLYFRDDRDGKQRAVFGESFVVAVEFSDPVRARALLSYGNSSRPKSPHRGDQLELLSKNQLRPVWLPRSEIEAHLDQREAITLPN